MCGFCGDYGSEKDPIARGFVKASSKVQRQRTKKWDKMQEAIEKLAAKQKKRKR